MEDDTKLASGGLGVAVETATSRSVGASTGAQPGGFPAEPTSLIDRWLPAVEEVA